MKLEELLGDRKRSEEKDAVREFSTYLTHDLGYPASSIRAEVFVAPGAVADLAVLDPQSSAIRALIEFKRDNGPNSQSLQQGIRTVERHLKSLPPLKQVRAFVVLYGSDQRRIYEIKATPTNLDADEIASFPRWRRLRVAGGSSSESLAKFVKFTGALAEERLLLDRSLTESRKHLIALLDESTDELVESVLSEVISQIDLRFSDIASVDDSKRENEVFQSVLKFSDFLDSSRIRLDAFGDPRNQAVGDIIVPTHTYDLALGKLEREGRWSVFKPKIYQKDARDHFTFFPYLMEAKEDLALREAIQESWNVNNPANKLKSPPSIRLGSFGSGGTVIADPEEVKVYKSTNTAIIGFDMEAHAVVVGAVESGVSERVQVLVAKSICDFAGKDKKVKKDVKQRLAAYTSAQFFRSFYLKYISEKLARV